MPCLKPIRLVKFLGYQGKDSFGPIVLTEESLIKKEGMVDIKILGPGCPKCQQTEKIVQEVVKEAGVSATVEKITDIMEISGYGVFGTPAVVVDGEVKSVGKIPKAEEIKLWISA